MAEGLLPADEGHRLLGERFDEPPLSLVERRAFLRLPIEERRRILAEQAEQFAATATSSDWPDLETGDTLDD